jgi:glycerol kinase
VGTHLLAIDQGTTGTTVLVVSPEGEVSGSAHAEIPQHFPRPGWVEHDPEEIWASVVEVSKAAMVDAGVVAADLAGLGITNQRETTLAWDKASGRPVHNAIVWQDRRTADRCEALTSQGLGDLIRRRTGLLIDPYFSATKLGWLLDNLDGLRLRAERGEIAFGNVDSWLLWKLTGGALHATDATNASRTMLMDLNKVAWDEELCRLLGVPMSVLPTIEPSQHLYGETTASVFGAAVPIGGVIGDQQSSLFAQGCFEAGQTKNTYGTGSFVLQHTGNTPRMADGRLIATMACTGAGNPPEYALEGSIFVTGAAIQWLRDGLGLIAEAAETEALAAGLSGNDDVWFVPALTGLGAPLWDPHARGTVVGITRGTTRAHLARAALESIAYQTRDVVEVMTEETGHGLAELRVDGGASRNGWLMQFQADLLGVPVVVAPVPDTTSLGSAYAAGIAVGVWADRRELRRAQRSGVRYEPSMSADCSDQLYRRWGMALDRARGWAER